MPAIESSSQQLRAKGLSLLLIAATTAAIMAEEWIKPASAPFILPLAVAYLLFNFGFVWFTLKMRPYTRGTRIGAIAVTLNFVAMFLSDFEPVWFILSGAGAITAVAAAYMLFGEARTAQP